MALSADRKWLATAGVDGAVKVWDAATLREIRTLKERETDILTSAALGRDGKPVAVPPRPVFVAVLASVAFSPDGQRLASAVGEVNKPGEVKVWNFETGQLTGTLKGHTTGVASVAFSPDGKQLASTSFERVKTWDVLSGRETHTFKEPFAVNVAYSPDGKWLATAGAAGTVTVWDTATGKRILNLNGHTGPVRSVAFSPDGTRVVSASDDQTVKVWDAMTGQETLTLKGHTDVVRSAAFSPDGTRVVSAGKDGVKVWDGRPLDETPTNPGLSPRR